MDAGIGVNLQQQRFLRPSSLESPRTRLIARISNDYFLDTTRMLAELFGGELITALVFLAIARENLREAPVADIGAPLSDAPIPPRPDSERLPVTVYAVAKRLGLTYETTRRHVNRLIKEGYCRRLGGGLIVPGDALLRPDIATGAERHRTLFLRLLRDALRAGVVDTAP
jgi:CRP-like cAMP-binding protein